VAHIVDGGIQASGDRIRLTLRLIRASDAVVTWAGSYDTGPEGMDPSLGELAATAAMEIGAIIAPAR